MYSVGGSETWSEYGIDIAVEQMIAGLSSEEEAKIPNADDLLPEGIYIERTAGLEEPFIIEFMDGDRLEILLVDDALRLGMNSIPADAEPEHAAKNFRPEIIFSDLLGGTIRDQWIAIGTDPEFTDKTPSGWLHDAAH